jgi:UDP-glucose 4-epimerase
VKILLTGASSFTGFWFARELAAAGAEVTAALRGTPQAYAGVRAERARRLPQYAEVVADCAFGSTRFVELIRARAFDALCHHGAEARDYRSADFDVHAAVAANTFNARATLDAFAARGGRALVATGSVFEANEGAGPSPRRAFSPYGLSKGLTFDILDHWGGAAGLQVRKFVIANPFGPYEEARFVAHAVARWRRGEALEVRTPRYLRDNIHVDLLARAYARFVTRPDGAGRRFGPCGYLETQGAFAARLARELGARLNLAAAVIEAEQTDFSEPLARINRDAIDAAAYGWSEGAAWDALADYYRA